MVEKLLRDANASSADSERRYYFDMVLPLSGGACLYYRRHCEDVRVQIEAELLALVGDVLPVPEISFGLVADSLEEPRRAEFIRRQESFTPVPPKKTRPVLCGVFMVSAEALAKVPAWASGSKSRGSRAASRRSWRS